MLSQTFEWRSRRDTCATLLALLQQPPGRAAGPNTEHVGAARLLEALVEPEDSEALRDLVLAPTSTHWIRVHALRALRGLGLDIGLHEAAALDPALGATELRSRPSEKQPVRRVSTPNLEEPPSVNDVRRLEAELRRTVERPARPSGNRDALRQWAEGPLGSWRARRLRAEADAHAAMNRLLHAPVAALLTVAELEPLDAFFWTKLEAAVSARAPGAGRRWLARLLQGCPRRSDRRGAQLLAHLAVSPSEADLKLFRLASRHACPDHRYLGLHALDRLDAVDPVALGQWVRDPAPRVRVRCRSALALRGDPVSHEDLRRTARAASVPVWARAEAVDALAALHSTSDFALLESVLFTDRGTVNGHTLPAAEAAASALARRGTPRALSALVRAALRAPANSLSDLIEGSLRAIAAGHGPAGCPLRRLAADHPLRLFRFGLQQAA